MSTYFLQRGLYFKNPSIKSNSKDFMMNQEKTIIGILAFFVVVLFCTTLYFATRSTYSEVGTFSPITPPVDVVENTPQPEQNEYISYLVSDENTTKFCDGAVMDSDGYRKTITTEVISSIRKSGLTTSELAKETAVLATQGMCREVLQKTDFTVMDGVVKIAPISGWAGSSITFCSCQPQVEVNLLRIPGFKQVIWSSK